MKRLFIISMLIFFMMSKAKEKPSGGYAPPEIEIMNIQSSREKYFEIKKSFDSSFNELKKNTQILETKINSK